MTNDYYRQRASAEFAPPGIPLALTGPQRRACVAAGLALEGLTLAIALHAMVKPDLAHLAALIASSAMGLPLLVVGCLRQDVFPLGAC